MSEEVVLFLFCPEVRTILRSCQYCGRIHDTREDCGKRPVRIYHQKRGTQAERFRSTAAWTRKSLEIRQRDGFCCQACIRKLSGTTRPVEYDGLSVHHAVPLEVDYGRRLDNDNLITLCKRHHDMAERGVLDSKTIQRIIAEQEGKRA